MHDIGKIGIARAVLNKPGKLSTEEYDRIKEHIKIGEQILQNVEYFKPILPLISNHHKWFDGNGYPENKEESDLLLESEILSVADVYDALTSDRPYRDAMSTETALSELKSISDTQLSPRIVDVFIEEEIYNIEHKQGIGIDFEHVPSEI